MGRSKTTFQLDIDAAGLEILQGLAQPIIKTSGIAILARAASMAASMTADPPTFTVEDAVGISPGARTARAYTLVTAPYENKRQEYVAHMALAKARDAGRV